MNPSFQTALAAAHEAAGPQHYPAGALYVVATPIGNLADITLRALHVLGLADTVACEDTRHTASLLQAYGLQKPLIAVHQHNEAEAASGVLQRLRQGERVAYVSDAGTPGISDPGARLCAAVTAAGLRCVPLPGASSITALISVAGLPPSDGVAFEFTGFLPSKGGERNLALRRLAQQDQACVLLEAPHRITALAQDLAALGERQVTLGRELTKQFEDIVTLRCDALGAWLAADAHRVKGEFALVLHPLPTRGDDGQDGIAPEVLRVLGLLLAELPVKTAAKLCADITGEAKNRLYQAALDMKAV